VHSPAISPGSFDRELSVDVDILNFALTLEHIENAFYTQGLSNFKQEDFVHAGFPDWSYGRLKQIAAHEAAHVEFLEGILGDKATKPCTYKLFVIMVFGYQWLTAFTVPPALIMTPNPLSLLVTPLRLLASVSLSLIALVSHVIS
jgi:Ferritin-like domain